MSQIYAVTPKMLMGIYAQQLLIQTQLVEAQQQLVEAQQQLVEAQREIIKLQNCIAEKTPPTPADKEVFWHKSSGIASTEAALSNDLPTARKFLDWNHAFAEEHVKPYVNPKVYTEVVNQMTRGLAEHVAALQTESEIKKKKKRSRKSKPKGEIIQMHQPELAMVGGS